MSSLEAAGLATGRTDGAGRATADAATVADVDADGSAFGSTAAAVGAALADGGGGGGGATTALAAGATSLVPSMLITPVMTAIPIRVATAAVTRIVESGRRRDGAPTDA